MGKGLVDKPHLQRFKTRLDEVFATKVNVTDYATTQSFGIVKPDGTTITVNDGVLSGASTYELPTASRTVLGGVKIDGSTINIDSYGTISASAKLIDYSTLEQDTGTLWVDGESIYQKTLTLNLSCTGGQWNEIANVPTRLSKLIKGFAENNTFTCSPDMKVENGKLYIYPQNSFTLTQLTVQYTKDMTVEYMYDLTWEEANEGMWSDYSETMWKEST